MKRKYYRIEIYFDTTAELDKVNDLQCIAMYFDPRYAKIDGLDKYAQQVNFTAVAIMEERIMN